MKKQTLTDRIKLQFKEIKNEPQTNINAKINSIDTLIQDHRRDVEFTLLCDLFTHSGRLHTAAGNAFKALSSLNKAYSILNLHLVNDKLRLAYVYRELCIVYGNFFKDFQTSLDYCFKGYALNVEELNVIFLNNIGSNYMEMGMLKEAEDYFQKGIDEAELNGLKKGLHTIYYNISELHYIKEEHEQAIVQCKRCIDFCESEYSTELSPLEYSSINAFELVAYLIMAKAYFELKQAEKSEQTLHIAKEKISEYKLDYVLGKVQLIEGHFDLRQKKYASFKRKFETAIKFCEEYELYFDKDEWLHLMVKAAEEEENFHDALHYSKEIVKNKEDIYNKHKEVNISSILVRKEEEILQLENRNRIVQLQKEDLEQFAYIVAHDLKTPISNMSNFSGLLSMKYEQALDKEGKEYLNFINSNSKKLYQMLTDLMRYISLDKNALQKQQSDVHQIVERIIEKKNWRGKDNIHILVDSSLGFPMPEVHLESLLDNLMSNAYKFSKQGEDVKICITHQQDKNNHLLHVSDNGIGVEPAYRNKIFEIFKRLDKNTYEGTGVGLALCKKIVDKYRGKIWVSDSPNGGSIFNISIPKPNVV